MVRDVADLYNEITFFNPHEEYHSVVNELKESYPPKIKAKRVK